MCVIELATHKHGSLTFLRKGEAKGVKKSARLWRTESDEQLLRYTVVQYLSLLSNLGSWFPHRANSAGRWLPNSYGWRPIIIPSEPCFQYATTTFGKLT